MFDRTSERRTSSARDQYEREPQPGRSTLVDEELLASPPLFKGDEQWEDIEPAERAAPAAPKYADLHRKTVRDYKIGKQKLRISDLANRGRGYANQRTGEMQFADESISVDIGTVVGSPKDGYRSAYVLVWHTRGDKADDPAANPKRRSADPTGWIKVGKLPRKAREDIAAFQDKERSAQKRGTGPGHKAPKTTLTAKLSPVTPEHITEKYIPRPAPLTPLEAFRIKGGGVDPDTGISSSTPCGNYTLNDRYGANIVGVWNPPGSTGSNGVPNTGSGGIRVFVPVGHEITICDVTPIEIPNFDVDQGAGISTWVYVTTRLNHEQLYFWMLQKWTFTDKTGKDRSGSNF